MARFIQKADITFQGSAMLGFVLVSMSLPGGGGSYVTGAGGPGVDLILDKAGALEDTKGAVDLLRKTLKYDPLTNATKHEDPDPTIKLPPEIAQPDNSVGNRDINGTDYMDETDSPFIIAGYKFDRGCIGGPGTGCYRFSFTEATAPTSIKSAKLTFYTNVHGREADRSHIFRVYLLYRDNSTSGLQKKLVEMKQSVPAYRQNWIDVDITSEVKRWVDQSPRSLTTKNKMLSIECSTCGKKSYSELFGETLGYKPLLLIYQSGGSQSNVSRPKREANCSYLTQCCRHTLYVRFDSVGIHHVIHPTQTEIGYCYGNCNGFASHDDEYHHSVIANTIRQGFGLYGSVRQAATRRALRLCCVPTSYLTVSLYTLEGRTDFRNLRVNECGCLA